MRKSLISLIILISLPVLVAAGFNFGFIKAVKKKVDKVDEKVIEKKEEIRIANLNNTPVLSWTNEANYISDGLNPEIGYSTTTFIYRIKYTDADNDAPASGYPKVHIKKTGTEITGSPFAMTYVSGTNSTGGIYTYSTTTLLSGTDYTYYFEAQDSKNATAIGAPISSIDAPDISNTAPNNPNTPSGIAVGAINASYEFATSATDSDSDQVQYRFDWGDGSTSTWTSLVDSGSSASISYAWSSVNTYYVKAQAKDSSGAVSGWSNALTVTVNPFTCGASTMDDADGNTYNTVLIGSQCWMKENLNYDGDSSGNGCKDVSWVNDTDVGWCGYYTGGPFTDEGLLYQWSAAMNGSVIEGAQGICPSGWHIPTDAQYKTLEMALGMLSAQADALNWRGTTEGDELKKSGLCEGRTPCGSSGFDILLAGTRHSSGSYNLKVNTNFWSSTLSSGNPWERYLNLSEARIYRNTNNKANGISIRCLKD